MSKIVIGIGFVHIFNIKPLLVVTRTFGKCLYVRHLYIVLQLLQIHTWNRTQEMTNFIASTMNIASVLEQSAVTQLI
jgi:hypothetical protein